MTRKWLREVCEAAEALGVVDIQTDRGKRHWKVVGQYNSQTVVFTVPNTGREVRRRANMMAQLRRVIRAKNNLDSPLA